MNIAIGCDHIVTDVKIKAAEFLKKQGHTVIDVGTYDFLRTHYPIFGRKVGKLVSQKKVDLGICICGTGVGINSAAQKVQGVRGALVSDVQAAIAAKENLNANLIGMGGRVIGIGSIEYILDAFLTAKYKPTPEKDALIEKIDNIISDNDCISNDNIFDKYLQKWDAGFYND